MTPQNKIIGLALFLLILMSWLSFGLHTDPRFAGSFYGGMLGIAATFFILTTYIYVGIRRIPWFKRIVLRVVSLNALLKIHIYAGIIGSILALLHTGHKFESLLGISLTAVLLGVVFSGFIGQYLMIFISEETREKKISLSMLEQRYRISALELAEHPDRQNIIRAFSNNWFVSLLFRKDFRNVSPDIRLAKDAHELSESIADLEYALQSHATMKIIFGRWIKIHIFLSILLLILLAMHIWSSFYYGIRWLQ